MIDLKLDGNHDLLLRDNKLVLVKGANKTAQQIKIALLTFLGEWFLDTSIGVPYLEDILVKPADKIKIESIFRQKILAVDKVKRVLKIETAIDRSARALVVSFSAETEQGIVSDSVKLGGNNG